MRKLLPFIICLALFCAACSDRPKGVLSHNKMKDVLTDIYKGESVVELSFGKFRSDSSRLNIREAVFAKYNITEAEFDSSLSYYGRHLDEYVEMHDEIIERLEKETNSIKRTNNSDSHIGGDSVNVWSEYPRYVFSGNSADQFLKFNLSRDENWQQGDNYTWQFKVFNMPSKSNYGLYVDYEDGTTDIINSTIDKDGWNRIIINMDTARTPVSIYGFTEFKLKPEEKVFIDSLSLVRKRFDEQTYRRRYNTKKFTYATKTKPQTVYHDYRHKKVHMLQND